MSEGMPELPVGWAWSRLGDLFDVNPRGFDEDLTDQDLVSRVPMAAVEAGTGRMDPGEMVRYGDVRTKSLTRFQENDVLFAKITPCMENGKIALASGLHGGRAVGSTEFHVFRSREGMAPRYLLHYLLQSTVRRAAEANMSGAVGQRRVPRSYLENLTIPVPPLDEQNRIVESVEENLSRLDSAVTSLRAVEARRKSLRSQLVSDAVSGRTVLPHDEASCVELLSRVDEEVRFTVGEKRWNSVCEPAGRWRADLPQGWRWRTLGSLCVDIRYGTSVKARRQEVEDDVPVIRMGNIQDGALNLKDLKFLPGGHPDVEKLSLRDGDLLFNRTNSVELVGKSAVYHGFEKKVTYASYLIRCRLASGVDPDWVNMVVNSLLGRRYVASVLTQQVGQANVNSAKLALMPIPVPPEGQQSLLVQFIRDWEAALSVPGEAAPEAARRAEALRSALLRKAFNGELVLQDPTDEPAYALLERIAAERAAVAPRKKRAGRAKRTVASPRLSEPAPEPTHAPLQATQPELPL